MARLLSRASMSAAGERAVQQDMLSLGAFAFAAPGMLALLLVLPVIYWLLRMIPPLPKLVRFPAIRLLIGLEPTEQTPMKMPWWLCCCACCSPPR